MRRCLPLAFALLHGASASALIYMPDPNLRTWVESNFPGAISGEYIDETNPAVQAATQLDLGWANITDLYGISAFANAISLEASNNPIGQVSDLPYHLEYLGLNNCGLTGPFQAPYSVVDLNVGNNQITSLDISTCSQLQSLNCPHNQLTAIIGSWSVPTLNYLDCSFNQISTIGPYFPSTSSFLLMSHNLLTSLEGVSQAAFVDLSYNLITDLGDVYGPQYGFSLDVSHNLIEHAGILRNINELDLSFNPLTQGIDQLPFGLQTLSVTNTQMTCLPYLDHSLVHLYCTGNSFTCLPNLPAGLVSTAADLGFAPQVCGLTSPCYTPLPRIALRVFLQGPFDFQSYTMHDDLRAQGLLPSTEPYSALGFTYTGAGWSDTLDPAIFSVTGNDAIVDWIVVDMYPATDELFGFENAEHFSRPALVQRDGDVVGLDGSWPLVLNMPYGLYHAEVRHRNHLGAITRFSNPYHGDTTEVDFTDWLTTVCWPQAMHGDSLSDQNRQLWCGDVTFDHQLKYIGAGNDRDPILQAIGGSEPAHVASGVYSNADVNMDGKVKYVGAHNDRDPILVNIGGNTPAAVRNQIGF